MWSVGVRVCQEKELTKVVLTHHAMTPQIWATDKILTNKKYTCKTGWFLLKHFVRLHINDCVYQRIDVSKHDDEKWHQRLFRSTNRCVQAWWKKMFKRGRLKTIQAIYKPCRLDQRCRRDLKHVEQIVQKQKNKHLQI